MNKTQLKAIAGLQKLQEDLNIRPEDENDAEGNAFNFYALKTDAAIEAISEKKMDKAKNTLKELREVFKAGAVTVRVAGAAGKKFGVTDTFANAAKKQKRYQRYARRVDKVLAAL